MKTTILTILGGCLFGVTTASFACTGCHDPSNQIKIPNADNFQSVLSIPHPISNPSLQINVENAQLEFKLKQDLK